MNCPTCSAPGLIYQTPLVYLCPLCGNYASLTGAPIAPGKPEPPDDRLVTTEDFERFDASRRK